MEEKARQELLKSIYEQHWLHARHVEYERLWFMTAFIPVIGGLFTLLYLLSNGNHVEPALWYLPFIPLGIILIVCAFGYFLCLTWRAPFVEHTTLAREMMEQYPELKEYAPYTRPKIYRIIKVGWVTAHQLFLYFYSVIASSAILIGIYLADVCDYWLILSLVPLVAGWRVERYYQRREDKYREEMKKRKVDIQ